MTLAGTLILCIGVFLLCCAMWRPYSVGFRYCPRHRWVWCVTRHGIRKNCPICTAYDWDQPVRDRP